jgi:hypothetical protein
MKKIILSLLILSLIYSPLSAFDWSYHSFATLISNYWSGVKEDPTKAAAYVCLAGVATFCGYAIYKHYQEGSLHGTITLGDLEYTGKELKLNDNVTIKQLKVVHQGYISSYGSASCGYYALKNANYIGYFLAGNGKLSAITDLENVDRLFGPDGLWRNIIKRDRCQRVLKNYIYNDLKNLVKKEVQEDESDTIYKKNKIVDLIKTCLSDVASQYAMQVRAMTIENEDIKDRLLDCINKKMGELHEDQWREDYLADADNDSITQEALKEHICKKETIDRFVAQLSTPLVISSQNLEPIFSEYNKRSDNELSSNGNWLNGDEIKKLYDNQQSSRKMSLTVIENIDILDELDNSINGEIFSELSTISKKLRDGNSGDYIHKFILGTMSRYKNSDSGTCGHWFTCVLFKHGSKHDYIVADSLNINRLQCSIVHRLINQLKKLQIDYERREITKEESD